MYGQKEIEQQYREATGSSTSPTPVAQAGWGEYFNSMDKELASMDERFPFHEVVTVVTRG